MKNKLLDYLICPFCHSDFKLNVSMAEEDEIIEGNLVCLGCSADYPILRGIPRILCKDRDKILKRTAKNFGYSWLNVWNFIMSAPAMPAASIIFLAVFKSPLWFIPASAIITASLPSPIALRRNNRRSHQGSRH